MKQLFTFSLILISLIAFSQESKPSYKEMMDDLSYNFYEVVDAAEEYFSTIDKDAKGSGYKPFMRWVNANEYKYYPDGDRSQTDPYFVANQYRAFLKNNPQSKTLFNGNWVEIGPLRIDSITGHYSAGLGRVEDFYVDPNNANKIYLGSRSGGFWRTIDGGLNWQVSTDSLFATGVNAITASPTNSDSVLINVQNAQNETSHGIYRSTNGGLSWALSGFNPTSVGTGGLGTNFRINEVAYHPRLKDVIFVATNQGLYRSLDNLQSFSRIFSWGNIIEISFHPTLDSTIYFYNTAASGGSRDIILLSNDLGSSLIASNTISGNNSNTRVEISVSPQCPNCVYFASNNGVWISNDAGINFTFRSNSTQTNGGFAVSDLDTSMMCYGYVDLDNSTDGGKTFINRTRWSLGNTNGNTSSLASSYLTSTNYIHADVRNLKAVNGVFYAATDGFLCKSTNNGVNWQILSEGTGIRENYKLGVSQSNHDRSISGSQDNGTSIHTENGWVEFYGADGMEALIHPLNDDWMMGSVQYGNRRRTKNGGSSQTGASPSGSSAAYWIAPLAYDPNDHMTIYDFRNSVYKSTDFAENYTLVGSPSSFSGDIQRAAIAENNSNIIVVSRGANIDKSTDGGVTFSSIRSTPLPGNFIEDIAFDPNDDEVIVVVYGSYQNNNQKVFITTNGGSSWTNITHNLGSMPIRSVVIDHSQASNIYLGAEIGVFVKPMSSTSWSLYNPALPNVAIRELEINYGSNTLRAASWGRGLWEFNLLGRANHPAISRTTISNPPEEFSPKVGVDQFVTSDVQYGGNLSAVYLEWSVDSAVFGNRINMINSMGSTWTSAQALPQYPVGKKIYFKVFAVGSSQDTTETYKFMYEVKPFDYCTATGNNSSGNLYISRVRMHTLNQVSVNNAYTNYTSTLTDLFVDSTYSITVNANTGWSSNDFGAWIDFNGDADFDITERILFSPNSSGNSTASFQVPSHANVGDTVKMRVRLSYWTDPEPCGDHFGEVEDYAIVIRGITTKLTDLASTTEDFKVYPNPADGNFVVELTDNNENRVLQLFDVRGKLMDERQQNGRTRIEYQIDLESGSYYLMIKGKDDQRSIPIIIKN